MYLLTVDIGNTHVLLGVWYQKTLMSTFRTYTKVLRTAHEWECLIQSWLDKSFPSGTKQLYVIYSSVVPNINKTLVDCFRSMNITDIFELNVAMKLPITFDYPTPSSLGTDRIANAVSGVSYYGKNLIIIDFGTAVTFCLIDNAIYKGGVIFPGMQTVIGALTKDAAQLVDIPYLEPNFNLLGKSTKEALQIGMQQGYKSLVQNIVSQLKVSRISHQIQAENVQKFSHINQTNPDEVLVIATGGIVEDIPFNHELFDIIDINLTLKGLMITFYLNL